MGYIENIRKKVGNMPIILNSAEIIIQDADGKILLVQRKDTNNWGLPGGYMELGETFEETIHRELQEELKMKVNDLSFLHIFSGKQFYHEYPNGDQVYSVIALFSAKDYENILEVDNDEIQSAKFFNLHSLPNDLTLNTRTILKLLFQ